MMKEELSVLGFGLCITLILLAIIIKGVWAMHRWYHCEKCKQKVEWVHWHQKEEETSYTGWVWCPLCGHKQWEGFEDRVFG